MRQCCPKKYPALANDAVQVRGIKRGKDPVERVVRGNARRQGQKRLQLLVCVFQVGGV